MIFNVWLKVASTAYVVFNPGQHELKRDTQSLQRNGRSSIPAASNGPWVLIDSLHSNAALELLAIIGFLKSRSSAASSMTIYHPLTHHGTSYSSA